MEYANPERRELTINNMSTPEPLELEVWHHILIAVNKTGEGENRLYVNGTLVASTDSTMLDLYPQINYMYLGHRNFSFQEYFAGEIDEYRRYKRYLSEQEI